jgi:hypothetical protein
MKKHKKQNRPLFFEKRAALGELQNKIGQVQTFYATQ